MLLKKASIYNILIQTMALLVFIPGRFSYAILILTAYNFFILTGTLSRKLIAFLNLQELLIPITTSVILASAVFFIQILNFFSPLSSFVLFFSIFLAAVSSFLVTRIYTSEIRPLKKELKDNFSSTLLFSLFGLCFSLFRDIFGYGTITFPVPSGIYEIVLFKSDSYSFGIFWASVPGAIILLAVVVLIYSFLYDKFSLIKKIGE